jgi:hypothetical protein
MDLPNLRTEGQPASLSREETTRTDRTEGPDLDVPAASPLPDAATVGEPYPSPTVVPAPPLDEEDNFDEGDLDLIRRFDAALTQALEVAIAFTHKFGDDPGEGTAAVPGEIKNQLYTLNVYRDLMWNELYQHSDEDVTRYLRENREIKG